MSRNPIKNWMQDRPLQIQVWVLLSLFGTAVLAAAFLYAFCFLLPAGSLARTRWENLPGLLLSLLLVDLSVARGAAGRISSPFEKLAEGLERAQDGLGETIQPVSRRDEAGRIVNALARVQRTAAEHKKNAALFCQSVSHGLKTPIMVIQNCCAAYQDGIYGDEAIDIILGEAGTLEREIGKLLSVNCFEQMLDGQRRLESVGLDGLLENCRKRFAANRRGIPVVVSTSTGLWISGDAASLQTAFDNILENALRYARSYVRVAVWEEPEGVHLLFENDGEPVNPEALERLFEKFYKGSKGNSGLGLFIARTIVRFHGGALWAENFENGVRFHMILGQSLPTRGGETDTQGVERPGAQGEKTYCR